MFQVRAAAAVFAAVAEQSQSVHFRFPVADKQTDT